MTPGPGIEPGPHWWEASALTTAPSPAPPWPQASMLSRYLGWASENHRLESLETLRDWITEELEYHVKAMESIEGLGAKAKHKEDDRRKNRTFTTFRGRRKEASEFQRKCYLCQR